MRAKDLEDTELGRVYGKPKIKEVKEVEEVKGIKEAERKGRITWELRSWRAWNCRFTRKGNTKG